MSDTVTITDDRKTDFLLIKNGRGEPSGCVHNVLVYLHHDDSWKGKLKLNESSLAVEMHGAVPWGFDARKPPFIWRGEDDSRLAAWVQSHRVPAGSKIVGEAVQVVAYENGYHPIRDFLHALKWDGDRRLDTWLSDYLGAEPSEYHAAVGAKFLLQAVARVYRPGCKADHVMILEGPQGSLKSSALRVLGQPWFTDDMPELGTKDSKVNLRGKWIIEISELDSMARAEISRIKQFVTCAADYFRLPYGQRSGEWPRENVFCGSTNDSTYLRDSTGGRRFWPVRCGRIDLTRLEKDRDQLMAEAAARFADGESWWLDSKKLVDAAGAEQEARYDGDVWDELVWPWIAGRVSVSIAEVLDGCLNKPASQWAQQDRNRVARSLRAAKWERFNARSDAGGREWRYRIGSSGSSMVPVAGGQVEPLKADES
jgi:putative DNA primase/helicase